jgi:imidazole glycerol-phosphate synthase subunit HisH
MIAIINYEGGNLASVLRALEYLNQDAVITADAETIRSAERVIFPGVGSAQATMRNLKASGLDEVIREVCAEKIPFLGICIGVQVIFDHSQEENTDCLGLVSGRVERFPGMVDTERLKVPQIGWNQVHYSKPHPIFENVADGQAFYFVNSYRPVPASDDVAYATTEYGVTFPCVIAQNNIVATQFHLEKSGEPGLKMLENFCRWDGTL